MFFYTKSILPFLYNQDLYSHKPFSVFFYTKSILSFLYNQDLYNHTTFLDVFLH
jgi:hypothetical protein